jgi:hypothetical protein
MSSQSFFLSQENDEDGDNPDEEDPLRGEPLESYTDAI